MAHYCQVDGTSGGPQPEGLAQDEGPCCFIKQLPERLHGDAMEVARSIFPANAPGNVSVGVGVIAPARLAVLTTKYVRTYASLTQQVTWQLFPLSP